MDQGFTFHSHYDWTDTEFETLFATATLDPQWFSHEAHLRLAWIHLRQYGEAQAIQNIRMQLQRFVRKVGAADKYNETLTVAAVKAVHHFMERSEADNFMDFMLEFPRLKHNFRELIGAHYGFNIYDSPLARRQFLEPDLRPFT
ncbi:MAG: hypothetical protein KDC44_02750 [Phaeodactylibacter sp.]|nr:hypothetical protein [Phaeodactylibacter sp.]